MLILFVLIFKLFERVVSLRLLVMFDGDFPLPIYLLNRFCFSGKPDVAPFLLLRLFFFLLCGEYTT